MSMILLVCALMAFSFVAGVAVSVWWLRRYWLEVRDRQEQVEKLAKETPEPQGPERHTGIFGIEGTVEVVSHDVIERNGNMMVPSLQDGRLEHYTYQGPPSRQHRLILQEIFTPPAHAASNIITTPADEEDGHDPDEYEECRLDYCDEHNTSHCDLC